MPGQNIEVLNDQNELLLDFISKKMGIPYKLVIPESYEELVNLFTKGKVDLALFGAVTFLKVHSQANAVPLVMRDSDLQFTSYFITGSDNPAKEFEDFRGKRISFGSKLSTSGHMYPRYFLKEKGIIPEEFFFDIIYSGSHDKSAYLVRDGTVDLSAVSCRVLKKLFETGKLRKDEVRIFWETPYYTDYVWVARPQLNKHFLNNLKEAFLSLSFEHKEHRDILNSVHAKAFIPASMKDYAELEEILRELSL